MNFHNNNGPQHCFQSSTMGIFKILNETIVPQTMLPGFNNVLFQNFHYNNGSQQWWGRGPLGPNLYNLRRVLKNAFQKIFQQWSSNQICSAAHH